MKNTASLPLSDFLRRFSILAEFKCRPNCSKCCGPVPMEAAFIQRHSDCIQQRPREYKPISEALVIPICADCSCLFLNRQKHRCSIYEDRPDLCQKFGTIPAMPCPWIKPNGNPRSSAQLRRRKRLLKRQRKGS